MPRRHAQIARKFPHRPVGRGFVTLCSFVTTHPAVCKRQILRARSGRSCKAKPSKVKQSKAKQSKVRGERVGSSTESTSKSAVSDYVVSPRLGRFGSNTRERTHVLTSCRPNPPKPVELGLRLVSRPISELGISKSDLFPEGTSSSCLGIEIMTCIIMSFERMCHVNSRLIINHAYVYIVSNSKKMIIFCVFICS